MTEHELLAEMRRGTWQSPRQRLVKAVAEDELPVIREALQEAVTCIGGDLEYPGEIEVQVEDIALLRCRVDLDFPRFSATFELRALRRSDGGNMVYSVEEINK